MKSFRIAFVFIFLLSAGLGLQAQDILKREQWNAKAPVMEMEAHQLQYITIHHTATPQKPEVSVAQKVQALQRFSQSDSKLADGTPKPAWADVPYHFYIAENGTIAEGRDINYAGDTNTSYDPKGHVLIVLEGNFEKTKPGQQQLQSLYPLVEKLSKEYHINPKQIGGHKDYAKTACPGDFLYSILPQLRREIAEK
ncbi:peptidoglycan recognition protein family protein [Salegentibacter chungangensis]|uniref:Peptidoglycan recognition family protein n=1 Tax=Salegentibacter chungangensis TaxID=1335724 RepID=A0ABW3NNV3_9FLAO